MAAGWRSDSQVVTFSSYPHLQGPQLSSGCFSESPLERQNPQVACICAVTSVMSNSLQACQAPLFMGFSRQEYWGGLSCLSPRDFFLTQGSNLSVMPPAFPGGFFTSRTTWESHVYTQIYFKELAYELMEVKISIRLETRRRTTAQVQRPSVGRIPSYSGEVNFCSSPAFN